MDGWWLEGKRLVASRLGQVDWWMGRACAGIGRDTVEVSSVPCSASVHYHTIGWKSRPWDYAAGSWHNKRVTAAVCIQWFELVEVTCDMVGLICRLWCRGMTSRVGIGGPHGSIGCKDRWGFSEKKPHNVHTEGIYLHRRCGKPVSGVPPMGEMVNGNTVVERFVWRRWHVSGRSACFLGVLSPGVRSDEDTFLYHGVVKSLE